ncbi:MAG: hypothetical protein PHQ14_01485 [Chromatiales bacterium]|nr:hypothetical protein [Chromatiales bacterium]
MKIEGRPERVEEPKWRRRLRGLGWGVVILVVVTAIANLRMAPSTEGWVIDARSGEPLADVVVVAYWGMERAWAWSVAPAGTLAVFEVVTGEDGHYRVPGWGPRWATYGIRESSDPLIILFKSGYEPVILDNMTATGRGYNRPGAMYLPSMWDGKTVEMARFDGTPEERLKALWGIIPALEGNHSTQIPLLLGTLIDEERDIPLSVRTGPARAYFDFELVRELLEGK